MKCLNVGDKIGLRSYCGKYAKCIVRDKSKVSTIKYADMVSIVYKYYCSLLLCPT